jgi:hypothetical protein
VITRQGNKIKGSIFPFFLFLCVGIGIGACSLPGDLDVTPENPNEQPPSEIIQAANIPVNPSLQMRWNPKPGDRLQIQFSGETIDLTHDVEIYDLDLFETNSEDISILHKQGKKVICYINAGAWEDWRPDADQYLSDLLGNAYDGWPGERWLDIRQISQLEPVLTSRLDLCKQKGFDGVEPDNLDAFQTDTGFPISTEDQLRFNKWFADQAHYRGLSIGLKNDPDQILDLSMFYDYAILEDCFQYDWCDQALPFIDARKPVFTIEYTDRIDSLSEYCEDSKQMGFSLLLKNRSLDSFRAVCP